MLGDHPTIDRFKKFYDRPDWSDDELREEASKHFLLATPQQRENMVKEMDAGFEEPSSLQQQAQLMNHQRYFRNVHVALKSRNR